MGRSHDNNGPVLRGFQSPISGMFLVFVREAPRRPKPPSPTAGGTSEVALLAAGRNHPLLHHCKFCGQRACGQLHRQLLDRLYREIAAHLPRAAEDRLADHRRRKNHVVEHDGERPADVLGRIPAKGACAGVLKRKAMTGSLVR